MGFGLRRKFEQDGDVFTLVMMEATYDIELRFASSANVIGRDTVSAPADACPIVTSWSEGDIARQSWPEPTEDLAHHNQICGFSADHSGKPEPGTTSR